MLYVVNLVYVNFVEDVIYVLSVVVGAVKYVMKAGAVPTIVVMMWAVVVVIVYCLIQVWILYLMT
jgi:hypothetical protein